MFEVMVPRRDDSNAFMDGYKQAVAIKTQRARQNALSMAATDPLGAENALGGAGDFEGYKYLQGERQQSEQRQREVTAASDKASAEFWVNTIPVAKRALASGMTLDALDPLMQAQGAPPEAWAKMKGAIGASPQLLDVMEARAREKLISVQAGGAVFDPNSRQEVYRAPTKPGYLIVPERGTAYPIGGAEPIPGASPMTPAATDGSMPLNAPPSSFTPPQDQGSPGDLDALTRMLATEALGEGPEGMAAAAHVALNRARTGHGGAKSLRDVVYARNQFEGMSRAGQVTPEAYAKARQVAEAVMAGQVPDPTNGAVNFINPELQEQMGRRQPAWAPRGQGQRIGRHVFYGGGAASPQGQDASATAQSAPYSPDGRPVLHGAPKWREPPAPAPTVLTPAEVQSAGFAPGTVVQRDNGGLKVLQEVPAAQRRTSDGGVKLSPQDSKYLNEAREAARDSRRMVSLVDRFVSLNKSVATGPNMVQRAAGMIDPRFQEMKAIADNLVPAMRQGLPGAASDRDVAMFRSATVGVEKYGDTNVAIATAVRAAAKRAQDYAAFMEHHAKTNGNLLGAQEEWDAYAAGNPMFDETRDGTLKVRPQRPWRQYFGAARTPAQQQSGARRLTVEQASKLPRGTRFIGTDGQPRVRQ